MSVNKRIIEAVQDIAPCFPWEAYEGNEDPQLKSYFVFDYCVYPLIFGDDTPYLERYAIQLHYFCPLSENSLSARKKARNAIYRAGFTFPEEINGSDNEGQHYVFDFEGLDTCAEDDEEAENGGDDDG